MEYYKNFSNEEILDHLISLSKFKLNNDDERNFFLKNLKIFFTFIDTLNKVNTENIEPLYSLTEQYNVLREDIPEIGLEQDKALKEANKKFQNDNYFTIIKK